MTQPKSKKSTFTRRGFLGTTSALALGTTFIPRSAFGANDRVNIGCIGIGGKGASDVSGVAGAGGTIVALCDVDDNRRAKKGKDSVDLFPEATFYRDFREMLDKEGNRLDAVTVSTADHTHCHASVMAMRMGKHVYCQKPLSHSIWEARLMTETARKYKVATQMGNQAHAGDPIRRGVELIRAGVIGKVTEVHTWTNRPIWPQGMTERPTPMPVPKGLDWDLWLGPAPERPYADAYVPFKWRGWWDFGTGALGDMGCHIMDMPFWALDLKHPTTVEADQTGNTVESGPLESTITYTFPAGEYSNDLKYCWYDGKRLPSEDVTSGLGMDPRVIIAKFDLVMIGEKGKFFFKRSSNSWATSPGTLLEDCDPPQTLPRVVDEDAEWISACRGGPASEGSFDYSGLLSEFVLLGNLAVRLGKKIDWDGEAMKATNAPEADSLIRREYRKGWEL